MEERPLDVRRTQRYCSATGYCFTASGRPEHPRRRGTTWMSSCGRRAEVGREEADVVRYRPVT
jgi:hypothetical protein